jgi:prepilin-type N-terminal cleavage/methylation domain-containing protein
VTIAHRFATNHLMVKFPVKLNQNCRGFTLIELLTVIAVVGILAAILVPAIQKTRTSTLRTASASNLRQLYAACGLYSNDNNFRLLNSFVAANEETGRKQGAWCNQLIEGGYLSDGGSNRWPQNYKVLGSPIQRREASEVTIDKNPPRYMTYGMNSVLTMIRKEETVSDGITTNLLLAPGRTLYISEGQLGQGSQWFGVSVAPWSLPNNTDGIVTFVYADGHIGQMPVEELPEYDWKKYSDSWYFWKGYDK